MYSFKEESGAATIIENTIVIPIVLTVIMALFIMGYTLYERAVLESCTARAANYIAKTIEDPNYEQITSTDASSDSNEITGINSSWTIKNKPYRYLGTLASGTKDLSSDYARGLIEKNQVFADGDTLNVSVRESGGIFPKVTVKATLDYKLPSLRFLGLPSILKIESSSTAYVNQPAEFVRNLDYAAELLKKASDALGITERLEKIWSFANGSIGKSGD